MKAVSKKTRKTAPAKAAVKAPVGDGRKSTRITRADQAWGPAHREHESRIAAAYELTRVADLDEAHEQALDEFDARAEFEEKFERHMIEVPAETQVATIDQPKAAQDPQVVPPTPTLTLPLKFVTSALLTAAKDDIRYYLNGVFIQAIEGEVRICGTDGHRLIASRYVPPKEEPIPAWLKAGVILPRSQLAEALPVLGKNGTAGQQGCEPSVVIAQTPGGGITLRSFNEFASFKVIPLDGKFPDYAKVLEQCGELLARGEGDAMEVAAIQTQYLKGAADVAAKLGSKAIHSFIGKPDQISVFTFDGAPDTVLVVMPMRTGEAVSPGVVKLLGSGSINASVAALRAHVTRTIRLLESSSDKQEIKQAESKRDSLNARITTLLASVSNGPKQLAKSAV